MAINHNIREEEEEREKKGKADAEGNRTRCHSADQLSTLPLRQISSLKRRRKKKSALIGSTFAGLVAQAIYTLRHYSGKQEHLSLIHI